MSTNTYKRGTERLRNRSLSKKQWNGIYVNRTLYAPYISKGNPENLDTVERKKIHNRIMELVEDGRSKSEIVSILISEFPESNLRSFFDTYAQHHIDKKNKNNPVDEGR